MVDIKMELEFSDDLPFNRFVQDLFADCSEEQKQAELIKLIYELLIS